MAKNTNSITKSNRGKVRALIASVEGHHPELKANIDPSERELDRATVVEEKDVPYDVVTMNSRVRIVDMASNFEATYTIVCPAEAKIADNKISVLAPIGMALLGNRVGQTVTCHVPSGVKQLKIEEIIQPIDQGR